MLKNIVRVTFGLRILSNMQNQISISIYRKCPIYDSIILYMECS